MDRVQPWKNRNIVVFLTEHMDTYCLCLCVSLSLCISRQYKEERNEKEVTESGKDEVCLVALLVWFNLQKLTSLHRGFWLGFSPLWALLGRVGRNYIYIFIHFAACPGARRQHKSSRAKLETIQPRQHLELPSWGWPQIAKTAPFGHIFSETHKKLYPCMSLSYRKSLLFSRLGNHGSCSCSHTSAHFARAEKIPWGSSIAGAVVWMWNRAESILAPSLNWMQQGGFG